MPLIFQRLRPLGWLAGAYLLIGAVTRIALLVMTGSGVAPSVGHWLYAFGAGALFDLATFVYVAWPLVLFLWIVPTSTPLLRTPGRWLAWIGVLLAGFALCWVVLHLIWKASLREVWPLLILVLYVLPLPALAYNRRSGRSYLYGLALVMLFGLLFVAASELVFWQEFGVRFNFIAVDYLVYTTEVIGNIRESYPIGTWLALLAAVSVALTWLTRRRLWRNDGGTGFGARSVMALVWLMLSVLVTAFVAGDMKDRTPNNYVNELSGNGIFQFFAAFRSSHLDYAEFYRTLPVTDAYARVRHMLQTPDATYLNDNPHDLTREIRNTGPEKHLNVVLISVESLSADYLGVFGNQSKLTPHLDALSKQSLFFTNTYANGTRTVRGLEALALSIPPTPGDSVIKMKNNENLLSLADIFNDRGYSSEFVYGGYGYFDNMNYFFGHNGYTAVDRKDIPASATIHHENVWGVADEDLYTLALGQMDKIHAAGKPFFLQIMTTSNHRPFTFPAGRVNFPQLSRQGAVAYTDWSIADFIKRAQDKPYFKDTVFVITADHDASSAGKSSIPINRYHIPLLIYAPSHVKPQQVTRLTSQIDIAPTLLGLLHFSYRSRFFGYDMFKLEPGRERAFPSTYQKLGYLRGDTLTVLEPQHKVEQFKPDFATGDASAVKSIDPTQVDDAIAYYQVAANLFKNGDLARRREDATPVQPLSGEEPAGATSAAAPASTGKVVAPPPELSALTTQ